ncbi:hypothetical protein Q9966_009586 [Columba livia]|nr:hypothetical protein Q9966_009586 [Columba livia]
MCPRAGGEDACGTDVSWGPSPLWRGEADGCSEDPWSNSLSLQNDFLCAHAYEATLERVPDQEQAIKPKIKASTMFLVPYCMLKLNVWSRCEVHTTANVKSAVRTHKVETSSETARNGGHQKGVKEAVILEANTFRPVLAVTWMNLFQQSPDEVPENTSQQICAKKNQRNHQEQPATCVSFRTSLLHPCLCCAYAFSWVPDPISTFGPVSGLPNAWLCLPGEDDAFRAQQAKGCWWVVLSGVIGLFYGRPQVAPYGAQRLVLATFAPQDIAVLNTGSECTGANDARCAPYELAFLLN